MVPDLVGIKGQEKDGMLSLSHVGPVPVQIKGMQEQKTLVERSNAEMATPNARIATLPEQLRRLLAQQGR